MADDGALIILLIIVAIVLYYFLVYKKKKSAVNVNAPPSLLPSSSQTGPGMVSGIGGIGSGGATGATGGGANKTVAPQGAMYTSNIGISGPSATNVIQQVLNTMKPGDTLSLAAGRYVIEGQVFIPNISNITIQGAGDATFIDNTTNTLNNNASSTANSDLAAFGRSNQDNNHPTTKISNLTVKNMSFAGNQTAAKYLANNINMSGFRIDMVDNLLIEGINTRTAGLGVHIRETNGATIRNCKSTSDGAGPATGPNSKNVLVDSCYVYASLDDSYAVLGASGSSNITFRNCVADKGKAPGPDVAAITASCYKIDSGGGGGIANITYDGCKALNANATIGRRIQGGFISGDITVAGPITFTNCTADNCLVGYQIFSKNVSFNKCTASNCGTGVVASTTNKFAGANTLQFVNTKATTQFINV